MIYFVRDGSYVKIGFSTSVRQRLRYIEACNPNRLELIGCIEGELYRERALHRLFRKYAHRNEWFNLTAESLAKITKLLATRGVEIEEVIKPRQTPSLGTAELRVLAVKAECDPRTIADVLMGGHKRSLSRQRAFAALVEAGLLKMDTRTAA